MINGNFVEICGGVFEFYGGNLKWRLVGKWFKSELMFGGLILIKF